MVKYHLKHDVCRVGFRKLFNPRRFPFRTKMKQDSSGTHKTVIVIVITQKR